MANVNWKLVWKPVEEQETGSVAGDKIKDIDIDIDVIKNDISAMSKMVEMIDWDAMDFTEVFPIFESANSSLVQLFKLFMRAPKKKEDT